MSWTGRGSAFHVRWLRHLVKRTPYILGFIALLAVYHFAGVFWGRGVKLYILVGMLGVYAVVELALFVMRRKLRRKQPDIAPRLDSDSGIPWHWRLLDVVLGVSFAFGPPVIVSLVRRLPLSWESEFTGYHLLAMGGGVGVYLVGRAYAVKRWRQRHGFTNDTV